MGRAVGKKPSTLPVTSFYTYIMYLLQECQLKPTNSEFIVLIADKLQLQLKSSEVANF